MNIDDFLNGEFGDMDDEQKKLIKALFDLNNIENINPDLDFTKSGYFMHTLDSPAAANELDQMIKEHNMSQEINFIESFEGKLIEEIWTSENNMVRIKRYYPLTYDNINTLPTYTRQYVYDKMLDEALEKENYELAAEIRDSIIINE